MPTAFISSVKLKINMKKLFPDTFISDAISMKFQMIGELYISLFWHLINSFIYLFI